MAQEVLKLVQEVFVGGRKMGEVKMNGGKRVILQIESTATSRTYSTVH